MDAIRRSWKRSLLRGMQRLDAVGIQHIDRSCIRRTLVPSSAARLFAQSALRGERQPILIVHHELCSVEPGTTRMRVALSAVAELFWMQTLEQTVLARLLERSCFEAAPTTADALASAPATATFEERAPGTLPADPVMTLQTDHVSRVRVQVMQNAVALPRWTSARTFPYRRRAEKWIKTRDHQ